jgi:predicted nucleic acid-binding protein
VIYVDTSVALAELLAEDRKPDPAMWARPLVASRLLEHELWVRLHARGLARSHGDAARDLLTRVSLVELVPLVLDRALERFPTPVRTLDALHLATIEYLRRQRIALEVATFDDRMRTALAALAVPIAGV